MTLKNPACIKAGYCIKGCGMCHLQKRQKRILTKDSLYGSCRAEGKCTCGLCPSVCYKYQDYTNITEDELYNMASQIKEVLQHERKHNREVKEKERRYNERFRSLNAQIYKEVLYVGDTRRLAATL